jgi:hypothetical protein
MASVTSADSDDSLHSAYGTIPASSVRDAESSDDGSSAASSAENELDKEDPENGISNDLIDYKNDTRNVIASVVYDTLRICVESEFPFRDQSRRAADNASARWPLRPEELPRHDSLGQSCRGNLEARDGLDDAIQEQLESIAATQESGNIPNALQVSQSIKKQLDLTWKLLSATPRKVIEVDTVLAAALRAGIPSQYFLLIQCGH